MGNMENAPFQIRNYAKSSAAIEHCVTCPTPV